VRDYSKYNFVTPIMKPDEDERDDVLKGVLRNYGRFTCARRSCSIRHSRDKLKRRYMLGCLKAFAKTTATKSSTISNAQSPRLGTEVDFGSTRARCSARADRRAQTERPELGAT